MHTCRVQAGSSYNARASRVVVRLLYAIGFKLSIEFYNRLFSQSLGFLGYINPVAAISTGENKPGDAGLPCKAQRSLAKMYGVQTSEAKTNGLKCDTLEAQQNKYRLAS